jgi:hypothetical protein
LDTVTIEQLKEAAQCLSDGFKKRLEGNIINNQRYNFDVNQRDFGNALYGMRLLFIRSGIPKEPVAFIEKLEGELAAIEWLEENKEAKNSPD